jgi:hypothetical protein
MTSQCAGAPAATGAQAEQDGWEPSHAQASPPAT